MPLEFEGEEVFGSTVALPTGTLEADETFAYGTVLTLTVQVRVKGFNFVETKNGLVRRHTLALESAAITDVLTPAQRRAILERQALMAENPSLFNEETGPYRVTEDPSVEDVYDSSHDHTEPPSEPGETPTAGSNSPSPVPEAHDQQDPQHSASPAESAAPRPGSDVEDDDSEHSWMDEDDSSSVRAAFVDREGWRASY